MYQLFAPSTSAASSISLGRPLKNWVKMYMYNPLLSPHPKAVRIKVGHAVLCRFVTWLLIPKYLKVMYSGNWMVCRGTTIITTMQANHSFLSGKLYLAKP